MGGAMGGMLKGGAMAGAAAVGYLGVSAFQAGLDMTGSFDKAQASFTALTGSVKEGDILLDKVKDFAFKTPFDVKQVADQTRNLLAQGQAYGVTKDNVLDYAKAIGDAVALTGGGETEFQRVTRALGQMGSSSKVMAQDMNQLQQSIPGINVWKELGEGLGVTEAEARDMGQAGLIPGAKAANILTEAMREMPGAAGEMERQAATVTGALQNFKEQATSTLTEGMRPFTDLGSPGKQNKKPHPRHWTPSTSCHGVSTPHCVHCLMPLNEPLAKVWGWEKTRSFSSPDYLTRERKLPKTR